MWRHDRLESSGARPPVTIRPATEADFVAMFGHGPKWRVRALAAEIDGTLVGIGGLGLMMPGETWCAFMQATDAFRARPVALHRAGLRMMAEARGSASAAWSRWRSRGSTTPGDGSRASASRRKTSTA